MRWFNLSVVGICDLFALELGRRYASRWEAHNPAGSRKRGDEEGGLVWMTCFTVFGSAASFFFVTRAQLRFDADTGALACQGSPMLDRLLASVSEVEAGAGDEISREEYQRSAVYLLAAVVFGLIIFLDMILLVVVRRSSMHNVLAAYAINTFACVPPCLSRGVVGARRAPRAASDRRLAPRPPTRARSGAARTCSPPSAASCPTTSTSSAARSTCTAC